MEKDFNSLIYNFSKNAIPNLEKNVFPKDDGFLLTYADKLSMLVAFCGIVPEDVNLVGKTLALGFKDKFSGRLIYQTAPVQNFHYSPFKLLNSTNKKNGTLVFNVPRELQKEYRESLEWNVLFGGNFLRQRTHHFNQSDCEGNLLPVSLIVNPKMDGCDEMCGGCARVAMKAFTPVDLSGEDYIEYNSRTVDGEFQKLFPRESKSELKYLNIMTGCQPTSKKEAEMFLRTMQIYKNKGFNPEFVFFTNLIEDEKDMVALVNEGAIGYGSTLETINDEVRIKNWGKRKGSKTFSQYLETLRKIKNYFKIGEVSMVLGQDNFDELKEGIQTLGDNGITIVGNIQRAYNSFQLKGIHSSLWEKGFDYFTEIFELILKSNSRHIPTARYMRQRGLEYLEKKYGREVQDFEMPYKYRG